MNEAIDNYASGKGGIRILGTEDAAVAAGNAFRTRLEALGLADRIEVHQAPTSNAYAVTFTVAADHAKEWAPGHDTTQLCETLGLDTAHNRVDLEKEILLAMLLSPLAFDFPGAEELAASVRIRMNIVEAAHKAVLAFNTVEAERPADYWTYAEATGFSVKPGKTLIAALQKATQPDETNKRYSFSCYRATEDVTLLGIAQELDNSNPVLGAQLQRLWETRAIMSGEFHDVFLREYGTMEAPLPLKFYVPGDRLWFRNPDEHSSDVEGYEGSWLFYLGNGLFNNFWKPEQPFTLRRKCLEIYHWRHGTYRNAEGTLHIDDAVIDARVAATLADPEEHERIQAQMLKLREPRGVYIDGGCIDATRECVRWVLPTSADLALPER